MAIQLKETEINALSEQVTSLLSNMIGGASAGGDMHDQGEIEALVKRKATADDNVRNREMIQAREGGGIKGYSHQALLERFPADLSLFLPRGFPNRSKSDSVFAIISGEDDSGKGLFNGLEGTCCGLGRGRREPA